MRRPAFVLALAVALVAAACTSEAAAPPVTQELTTTTVATTSTTAAPTTTTTEPAEPTLEEIEAELIRVVEGADSVFLVDPIDPDTPLIDEFYTEELREGVRETLQQSRDDGETYFGFVDPISPETVSLDGDSAMITACVLDGIGVRDANDDVVVEPAASAVLVVYEFRRVNDDWFLAGVSFPGPERETCTTS